MSIMLALATIACIFYLAKLYLFDRLFVGRETSTDKKNLLIFIVVPIVILSLIILAVSCVVLCKRKKLYGGFYLLSYPPLPDYMKTLDMNGNIQDQVQKLPFLPEWEFPRDKITFGK